MTNDDLRLLELNEYESRAYLALLEADATAYELGKRSGIPLSRCYEVARALVAKGMALVQPGATPRYRAVAPREAVARRRAELERGLGALEDALEAHAARAAAQTETLWALRGREAILHRAAEMLRGAADRVELRASTDALDALAESLAMAAARGARVREEPVSGVGFLLVVDQAALLGELAPPESCLAVHSTQPGLVALLAAGEEPAPRGWLDWEDAKVRRLLESVPGLRSL